MHLETWQWILLGLGAFTTGLSKTGIAGVNMLAGVTTMVANAAGPIMGLYLLAIGLPKLEFVAPGACFFLLVNPFKVPFSTHLGLITADSLWLDARLLAPMVPGALLGPVILRHINQRGFAVAAALARLGVSTRPR